MRKITFQDRLRYQFDNLMARGPIALIGWLFLVSAAMVIVVALIVLIGGLAPPAEGGGRPGLIQLIWISMMHTMDAGTLAGDAGSPAFLLSMLGVTIGGIFIVSILIGVLTSGI